MTVFAGVDLLIAIDDTDDRFSPGTGRRARALLCELAAAGLGSAAGATRHQLLVDDRVPYTSHNSSACLAWRSPAGDPHAVRGEIIDYTARFLERVCPPAADPGLAVAVPADLSDIGPLVEFGRRAKREVLHRAEARHLADELGVQLSGHGGTHDGVVGALSAIGLQLSGDDGLFITLPGLADLPHAATVDELLASVPIDEARDGGNRRPAAGERIELGDWVRPVLLGGAAVLLLEPPVEQPDGRRHWRTAPRAVVKKY
ncbi:MULTISPECIES: hypothetical protein [Mycobacteriaceae]|uniref:tRNA(Ile2) 2-agmatinylcytidine synthetase n=3 Tax=Mycobacteriaceae TaxID=1762 RepID=A0A7I9YGF0_MYCAL|nr:MULTISPECIES: hypothetical protein [Mycobacteriaceae]OQZ98834.1 hypothetical protein BST10_04430 [Mycolicibacter algericus DSM 45454]BBX12456.1 hypothetical protein MNVM_15370 [Mycobacterium novum]GFG87573.1 hypothetical protein MALGJ_42490 [Mycolicibacter algericus]